MIEKLKIRAEQGDSEAQYELGEFFEGKNNIPEACKWFEKAANQNHVNSQFKLGFYYRWGDDNSGFSANVEKGRFWLKQASEKGHKKAQFHLGNLFNKEQNFENAALWFEKAAKQGEQRAMFRFAFLNEGKLFSGANINTAVHYYTKLTENLGSNVDEDNTDAMFYLGILYCQGDEIQRDANKGKKLIETGLKYCASNKIDIKPYEYYRIGFLYSTGAINSNNEPSVEDLSKGIDFLNIVLKVGLTALRPQNIELTKEMLEITIKRKENLISLKDNIKGIKKSLGIDDYKESSAFSKADEIKYEGLLNRKKSSRTESEFRNLIWEFRKLNGYRDSLQLAEECENLAVAAKEQAYENLLQAKKRADSKSEPNISDYRELARQFSEMGSNYKDAATLSRECERIAFAQEQKKQYNNLLSRKSKAQSEDDFRILANDFRAMGDYQDVAALAKECETRYQKLKSERIHAEYTNALTTMKWLKKMKTRKPDNLRKLEKEWEKLARKFMTNADYKDASALAKECIKKSETACAKAKRIEKSRKRRRLIITLLIILTLGYGFANGWFKEVRDYSEGMAAVNYGNFLYQKWGFIDESGKGVIPRIYSDVLSFSEGLAAVKKGGKKRGQWGFIDKEGNVVIPFKYNYRVGSFSKGYAQVAASIAVNRAQGVRGIGIKYGLIDKRGNLIVPYNYYRVKVFDENLAIVKSVVNTSPIYREGVVSLRSGKEIIPCIHSSVSILDNVIEVKTIKNELQYFDKSGNRVRR